MPAEKQLEEGLLPPAGDASGKGGRDLDRIAYLVTTFGERTPIEDRVIIGRALGSALRIDDRTVSAEHAVVRRTASGFEIEDLRSRNGTYVNDERISGPTPLHGGERLRIGSHNLTFALSNVAAQPVPPTAPNDRRPDEAPTIIGTALRSGPSDPAQRDPAGATGPGPVRGEAGDEDAITMVGEASALPEAGLEESQAASGADEAPTLHGGEGLRAASRSSSAGPPTRDEVDDSDAITQVGKAYAHPETGLGESQAGSAADDAPTLPAVGITVTETLRKGPGAQEGAMPETSRTGTRRAEQRVALYRQKHPEAARWAAGIGPIKHTVETQGRVFEMAEALALQGLAPDAVPIFEILHAADRVASAGLWLVVNETYVKNVYLDGRDLLPNDFKPVPEGHTGGSLNMVPAYTGYMAANAITGTTRSWVMGQGHCVSAIDSINLILDNQSKAHAERYALTDEGLTRYVGDFYSYRLQPDGSLESPLGSHVNPYTAGGISEGGYLGFTSIEYVHMPLPGERLVAFLSDGAFEEQRGSDWAPRWWRSEDCGLVTPIMIDNGRRIDQRTQMTQLGGEEWFSDHLRLTGFDPIIFDGRDPAAFAWAIWEMESRLLASAEAIQAKEEEYPVHLPYGIAVAPKGAGFYGEGTNDAHNLPLGANPHTDIIAAQHFNESARRIWVPLPQLKEAAGKLLNHEVSGRPKERDHALATRQVRLRVVPPLVSEPVAEDRMNPASWPRKSPMHAVDAMFLAAVESNPHLRPRVGNPDEMRSNRMLQTLEALKFRVTEVEPGAAEAIDGAVITSLNEEAVVCAALGNRGGINIVVSYEAFAAKMQGAMRQSIIWASHANERGIPQGWLSVPVVVTSHTWENAKNEQSHQDPALAEAMLGEPSDISRVVFAGDYNSAAAIIQDVYQTHGQIWTVVVPKLDAVPVLMAPEESARLMDQGALRLDWAGYQQDDPRLVLTAIGAYQLEETLHASIRLTDREVPHSVVYMIEPGRFREPRSRGEREHAAPPRLRSELYPDSAQARIFVTHTRPGPLIGVIRPLDTGPDHTVALGFINHGGTLNVPGLLTINRCSAAHILAQSARLLGLPHDVYLTPEEAAIVDERARPEALPI